MANTAVLKDGKFVKVVTSAEEKKEFEGQEGITFMTKKQFEANDTYASWDEMIGKAKPVAEGEGAEKKEKRPVPELKGPYHLLKPLPACADDHPKKPIWVAIEANTGKTCEDAIAACPKENPKRKTSGVYTFASEFRYFLNTGYAALGEAPEGHDHTKVEAKPKREPKAKAAKNETTEGAQAAAE